ncbi:MAG: hypothetical protein SVR94_10330 [Pseudomonadota bacterium]|nr:hypothetical protein [Pseudomonadota bacterium]
MKNDFYSVPAMITPAAPCFSYQIYFLFHTQCCQGNETIQEPTHFAVQEAEHSELIGYAQIENKRLFRLSLKQVAPLTTQRLQHFLQYSWQTLYRQYEYCIVRQVSTGQISYPKPNLYSPFVTVLIKKVWLHTLLPLNHTILNR